MPHKPHYGDTGDEAQKMFEGFLEIVGQAKNHDDYSRRVNAVKVDGVPFR